jgi:hypothetical protein
VTPITGRLKVLSIREPNTSSRKRVPATYPAIALAEPNLKTEESGP